VLHWQARLDIFLVPRNRRVALPESEIPHYSAKHSRTITSEYELAFDRNACVVGGPPGASLFF